MKQDIEVALGPKGTFPKAQLARLVPAAKTIRAGRKRPKEKDGDKPPKIVALLHKAEEWRRLLDAGEIASQAEIARREGITRARVTQILGLLRLPEDVRAKVLACPVGDDGRVVTERGLRGMAPNRADLV